MSFNTSNKTANADVRKHKKHAIIEVPASELAPRASMGVVNINGHHPDNIFINGFPLSQFKFMN